MRKFEFVNRILSNEDGIKRLLPTRSTKNSAGYDFFNPKNIICKSHKITMIPTGIKAQFPEDEMLLLFNRSSNPKKKGLIILNGVGVVDSDYYNNTDNEGEMAFVFYNMLEEDVTLLAGEKLGQGIFVKYAKTDDDMAKGERIGGFGSTGKWVR